MRRLTLEERIEQLEDMSGGRFCCNCHRQLCRDEGRTCDYCRQGDMEVEDEDETR